MAIRYRHRPLRLSRGKHHAVKYLILHHLREVEQDLGYGAHRITNEIAWYTGHPAKRISALVMRWIRIGYIHRDGTWPDWRYGLRQKGRDWLKRADKWLPRAAEIRRELATYQFAVGITDVLPPLNTDTPDKEPKPEPEVKERPPIPPWFKTRAHKIEWEIANGYRNKDGKPIK